MIKKAIIALSLIIGIPIIIYMVRYAYVCYQWHEVKTRKIRNENEITNILFEKVNPIWFWQENHDEYMFIGWFGNKNDVGRGIELLRNADDIKPGVHFDCCRMTMIEMLQTLSGCRVGYNYSDWKNWYDKHPRINNNEPNKITYENFEELQNWVWSYRDKMNYHVSTKSKAMNNIMIYSFKINDSVNCENFVYEKQGEKYRLLGKWESDTKKKLFYENNGEKELRNNKGEVLCAIYVEEEKIGTKKKSPNK